MAAPVVGCFARKPVEDTISVIIDREFNVIAGHGRIAAAKEEGMEEVPCVFVDY